jgi:DNA-binding protein H-NS
MTEMNGLQKNTELGNKMKLQNINVKVNMNVEIDPETADGIVRASVKQTIEYLRKDIAVLKKVKKAEDYQKRDLAEQIRTLDAMEEVFDYYGGNLK